MIYFEDGAVKDQNLINFKQRKNVFSVIYLLQLFQQNPFRFPRNEELQLELDTLEGKLTDEQLMEESLKVSL